MNITFRKVVFLGGLAVMLAALSAAPAMAQTLYTNFGQAPNYPAYSFQDQNTSWPVGNSGGIDFSIAFPFTPTVSGTFGDAILAFGDPLGNSPTASVYLAEDNGGFPTGATYMLTQQAPQIPMNPTAMIFDCSGAGCAVALSINTQYWIVATDDTGWYQSLFYNTPDHGLFAFSQDHGATWTADDTINYTGSNQGAFEVDGPNGPPIPVPPVP